MTEDTKSPMALIDVWTHLSANNIVLSKDQMDSLLRFHDDMVYWNQRVNMVSRKDVTSLWERHILHSLSLLRYVDIPSKARVLDIGTGGGFPGLPLKIARPDIKLTLVDSTSKKITMVRMFGEHTGLKDIAAIAMRVEDMAADSKYRGSFDVIVTRAVAPLAELLSWSTPLLKRTGLLAALKGGDIAQEIQQAQHDHPGYSITEIPITMFGMPWFTEDEKKVVTCTRL